MGFEEWVSSRLADLLRFAMTLCCDRGVAEDTVQEVLIKAHRHWDRILASEDADAYVRRMIVNEYLTWRRKWSRYVPSETAGIDRLHGAEPDHAESHAARADLITRLAGLPPRQRAVIVLRYYAGLSDREIADILSCRAVTVRSHARRALARLRVELQPPVAGPQRRLDPSPEPQTGASDAH